MKNGLSEQQSRRSMAERISFGVINNSLGRLAVVSSLTFIEFQCVESVLEYNLSTPTEIACATVIGAYSLFLPAFNPPSKS